MKNSALRLIHDRARENGFAVIGVAPSLRARTWDAFNDWLANGLAAEMHYLARRKNERRDIRLLHPGARSVVVFALPYASPSPPTSTARDSRCGWVSRHSTGPDYHRVCMSALEDINESLVKDIGENARGWPHVDTDPILERDFAQQAGIGWIGKNTTVINASLGSWFFLCELVLPFELPASEPEVPDGCGNCTRCLDACPTKALVAPRVLDTRRCISYLTVENRGSIPRDLRPLIGNRVFGCDVCQEVCPWNQKAPAKPPKPSSPCFVDPVELLTLDDIAFRKLFSGTAVERTKRRGLLRNAAVVLGNAHEPAAVPALTSLLKDTDPMLREHAVWALARMPGEEAAVHLRKTLENETDPYVRIEIVKSLAEAHGSHP